MTLPILLDAALKGTALLVAVFSLDAALRRWPAAARHLLWNAGLVALIAIPVLSAALPWRVAVLPIRPRTIAQSPASEPEAGNASTPFFTRGDNVPAAARDEERLADGSATDPRSMSDDPATAAGARRESSSMETVAAAATFVRSNWLVVLAVIWLAGVTAVVARLLIGMLAVWRLARRGHRLEDPDWISSLDRASHWLGIARPVRLVSSPRAPMPFTAGFIEPLIVLPDDASSWSEDRRLAVLLHELAHLKRADMVTHLVSQVACAVYWFHPLVWVAARRLRAESERACDDLVLRAGTRPSEYAGHLLDIVRHAGRSWAPAIALPLAQWSEFEGRLLAILEPGVRRHGLTPLAAVAILAGIAITTVPLAALAPAARQASGLEKVAGDPDVGGAQPDALSSAMRDDGRIGTDIAVPDAASPQEEPPGLDSDAKLAPLGEQGDVTRPSRRTVPVLAGTRTKQQDAARASHVIALVTALGDQDVGVRIAAAQSLGQLEDSTAVLALMRALLEDTDAEVRRAAAWALGQIEDERAVPALGQALQRDQDVQVRRTATWALGQIEAESALPALAAAIRDSDVEVRRGVVHAMGEIESAEAIPMLMPALNDADVEIRRSAVWALGQIEDARAVPALTLVLREDRDIEARRTAVWALGEIESPEAIEPLSVALRDADPEVRDQAAWALGQIEDARAVPALTQALTSDTSVEVRRKAAWALGEIEHPSGVQPLAAALRDTDAEVRRTALWGLGQIEDPAAVEPLAAYLARGDADVEARRAAVAALGDIEDARATDALVAALQDTDAEVRELAVHGLGDIANPATASAIGALMRDPELKVRRMAVWALGELETPAAYEILVAALRDEDPEIRRAAAHALGQGREE